MGGTASGRALKARLDNLPGLRFDEAVYKLAAAVLLLPLAAVAQHRVDYQIAGFAPASALAAVITFSDGDIDDLAWAEAAILDGEKQDRLEPELRETLRFDRSQQPDDGVEAVRQVREKVAARLEERRAALKLGPWQEGTKLQVDAQGNAALDGRSLGRIRIAARQRKAQNEDDLTPPGWLNLSWVPAGGGPAVRLYDSGRWKEHSHASWTIAEARMFGRVLLVVLRCVHSGIHGPPTSDIYRFAARLP